MLLWLGSGRARTFRFVLGRRTLLSGSFSGFALNGSVDVTIADQKACQEGASSGQSHKRLKPSNGFQEGSKSAVQEVDVQDAGEQDHGSQHR